MKKKSFTLCPIIILILLALTSCFSIVRPNTNDKSTENESTFNVYLCIFSSDGTSSYQSKLTLSDSPEGKITPTHNAELYEFYGYYTEPEGQGIKVTDTDGNITADFYAYCKEHKNWEIKIYPHLIPMDCRINFVTNCEEELATLLGKGGDTIDLPVLSKEGHTFVGWSEDSNDWTGTFSYRFDKTETTLYAIFAPFTIKLNCRGIDKNIYQTVKYGSAFTLQYEEKDGYNFVGYFSEENGVGTQYTDNSGHSLESWNFIPENIDVPIDIYAYYESAEIFKIYIPNEAVKRYITVTYSDYYAEGVDYSKIYSESMPINFIKPSYIPSGYIFNGWYTDSRLSTKFTYDEQVANDIILYPKFTKINEYSEDYAYIYDDINATATLGFWQERSITYICGNSGELKISFKLNCPYDGMANIIITNATQFKTYEFQEIENGKYLEYTMSVNSGDIIKLTFTGLVNGELSQTVSYSLFGISMADKSAEVNIPDIFEVEVTAGNNFSLKVFEYDMYEFKGYFTEKNGAGKQITDEQGNSLSAYDFGTDIYLYAYYVSK